MDDLKINVADVNKDVNATVMIDAAQAKAIIVEWLKGQNINVKIGDIQAMQEGDWDSTEFAGFSFPLPMSVKFKAPCT
jgi:hypothetical protein